MKNVEQTIVSQYGNSATITQLIQNMNAYIDPQADIDNFYNVVWNVETAQGFGLDIWGRIVNISRNLLIPSAGSYFGFKDGLADYSPFGQEPFYNGSPAATDTYTLSDDAYRTLILAKALANISAANAPSINQLMQNLFASQGRFYVNDLGNMQMRYTFEFILNAYQFTIVTQSGVMIRPAGVGAWMISTALPVFGFAEAGIYSAAPFGQAPFLSPEATSAIV